jgi:hypothetical protein
MAINFPDSPTLNQEFTAADRTWKWDGSTWVNVGTDIVVADVTDLTASASEINILDGALLSTAELNYVDGVTSAIQTQLNGKVDEVNGAVTTASTSATVVRNITLSTGDPTGGTDGDVWLKYTA